MRTTRSTSKRQLFDRRFCVNITPELARVIDNHARAQMQTPSAWAREVMLRALTAAGVEVPPTTSHMIHQ
jgi:hypothetical protein